MPRTLLAGRWRKRLPPGRTLRELEMWQTVCSPSTMAANFGDPLALASYPVAPKSAQNANHLFVSGPAGGSEDHAATVLVQADGVHIIDVSCI